MSDIKERMRSAGPGGWTKQWDCPDDIRERLRDCPSFAHCRQSEALHQLGTVWAMFMCENEHLKVQLAAAREALDNSQSLLVMVQHLGVSTPGAWGISADEWKSERLTELLADQVIENHTALNPEPRK